MLGLEGYAIGLALAALIPVGILVWVIKRGNKL
jgi:hypothetical protein